VLSSDSRTGRYLLNQVHLKSDRTRVLLALVALYFIWGSTFLAIRIALQGIPPLLLAGLRYVIAGAALYAWASLRGLPHPSCGEWKSAFVVGTLLVSANACVVVAEQWRAARWCSRPRRRVVSACLPCRRRRHWERSLT
jgi:hypothetical protein